MRDRACSSLPPQSLPTKSQTTREASCRASTTLRRPCPSTTAAAASPCLSQRPARDPHHHKPRPAHRVSTTDCMHYIGGEPAQPDAAWRSKVDVLLALSCTSLAVPLVHLGVLHLRSDAPLHMRRSLLSCPGPLLPPCRHTRRGAGAPGGSDQQGVQLPRG